MKITAVLAMDEKFLIGKKDNNALPWHIPEDLKRFQAITRGGIVVMGSRTYDSLPNKSKPLPNRRNIVISRNQINEIETFPSIETFLEKMLIEGVEEVFLIGGATLYDQFFDKNLVDKVELTLVEGEHHGKDHDNIYVKDWRNNFHEVTSEDFISANGIDKGRFITLEKN